MRKTSFKKGLLLVFCFIAWAAGVVTADAKILIVAPHPDDDVISSAGVTYNAVKNGEPVRVLIMTNGDAGIEPKGTQAGLLRQSEAVAAQSILGMREDDVVFLGYPDAYLQTLYYSYPNSNQKLTTSWGQSATYGNRGLGRKDYHYYRFGTHASYNGYNILLDLADLLTSYRPDHIFVTSEFDGHWDHTATYRFVRDAVLRVHGNDPSYMPALHKTIIWWGEGYDWPNALDVKSNFVEIPNLSSTGLSWTERESLEVPLPLQSTDLSKNPKYQAQAAHVSQANLDPVGFLTRFVHKDEIFWMDDLPGFTQPPSSSAGPDQIVGEGAVVRLDGTGSVSQNGSTLSFQWRQTDGRAVALSNAAGATPSFTAPAGITTNETLIFQLVVSEAGIKSLPDQVKVTVRPGGTPSFTLTVSTAGTGSGTVNSSPAGIDCGATCSTSVVSGTTMTLSATPDAGSTFAGWGGACSGSGSCTVTVTDSASVTANFTTGGLVAAYAFDEGTGTTTADASGNGLKATLSGGSWTTTGKNGAAVSYNGSTTLVTVADSDLLDLSTGMTLEAWVNPAASPNGWKSIIMKEGQGFYVYALYLSPTGHPAVYLVINGQEQGFEIGSAIPAGTWTHLAATFDGSNLRLYKNGILATSQPVNATIPASTGALRIGGNSIWSSEHFNGKIDDVRIYNRALGAAEVAKDMNTPANGEAVPVPVTLSGLVVTPSTLVGGTAASASVTLTGAAPTGGATVALASDSTSVVVPATLTVPAGAVTASTSVSTKSVASTTTVTLTGSYNGTSKTSALTVTPPLPSYVLSVRVAGTGTGTITSSPAGIDCGATCSATYPSGTLITLSATPGTGSVFTGWSGACSGTGSCTVTVASAQSVTANFGSGQLVAAYAFDEGSGTTAADASGNGQNGVITSGSWTTSGKHGTALTFNGSSSWVTVPDSVLLDLSTSLTLEAWIYPTAVPNNWKSVMMKEDSGFYVYGLYLSPSSHPAVYLVIGGLEHGLEVSSTTLPINVWSHVAVTYDGAMLRVYVNGTEVGSQAVSGTVPASAGVLRIGGNSIWNNEFFKGRIDDVRIYNRPLTRSEVQSDMATGAK